MVKAAASSARHASRRTTTVPKEEDQLEAPVARPERGGQRGSHLPLNASDVIDQRYRLERELGTGGMSEVWLAEDTRLGRWVAAKVLREADMGSDFADNLEREARLVARLQHPNLVSVYDAESMRAGCSS